MSVLVVGSIALDSIRTPFGRIKDGLGGSATYFSISAGHFSRVRLVAVVGEDFPEKHVTFLRTHEVDLEGLCRAKGKTFRWQGEYLDDLNEAKTLKTELNVFQDFQPELPLSYRKAKVVFLANIDPVLQKRVLEQIEAPRLVACDTMNFWIESKKRALKQVLAKVDIFFLNEGEARQLTGKSSIIHAGRALLSMGPAIVVVKRGEYGSMLFKEDRIFLAPAFPQETVRDPTGAGDSFAGGFMGYLSRGGELTDSRLRRALAYGSIMASFNVEDFSLKRLSRVTSEEIATRLKVFRELTRF